jgi:hypothetical protein
VSSKRPNGFSFYKRQRAKKRQTLGQRRDYWLVNNVRLYAPEWTKDWSDKLIAHARELVKQGRLQAGMVTEDGIEEGVQDWCVSDEGQAVALWLTVRDEYKTKTGRPLRVEDVARAVAKRKKQVEAAGADRRLRMSFVKGLQVKR